MFLGSLVDTSPCLGQACVQGIALDPPVQYAGALLMIVIVLALAWYGNKRWRGKAETMIGTAPA